MHIKTLKLQNFRNYEDARFVLDPAVNLICGENAGSKLAKAQEKMERLKKLMND